MATIWAWWGPELQSWASWNNEGYLGTRTGSRSLFSRLHAAPPTVPSAPGRRWRWGWITRCDLSSERSPAPSELLSTPEPACETSAREGFRGGLARCQRVGGNSCRVVFVPPCGWLVGLSILVASGCRCEEDSWPGSAPKDKQRKKRFCWCRVSMRADVSTLSNKLWANLVTDQVPLLLVVVLSEEAGFVWRQVHGILKNKTRGSFTATFFPVFNIAWSLWRQHHGALRPLGTKNNDLTSCVDCQRPTRRGDPHFLRAPKSRSCSDVS